MAELKLSSDAAIFCVYQIGKQLEVFRSDQLSQSKIDRSFFKKVDVGDVKKLDASDDNWIGVVSDDNEISSIELPVAPFLAINDLEALQVDFAVGDDGKSFFENPIDSVSSAIVDTNGENGCWNFIGRGKSCSIISPTQILENKLKTELNLRELEGNLSDIIRTRRISIFGKDTPINEIIEKILASLKDGMLDAFTKISLFIVGNEQVVAGDILGAMGFTIADADVRKISILSGLAKAMFIKMAIEAEGSN